MIIEELHLGIASSVITCSPRKYSNLCPQFLLHERGLYVLQFIMPRLRADCVIVLISRFSNYSDCFNYVYKFNMNKTYMFFSYANGCHWLFRRQWLSLQLFFSVLDIRNPLTRPFCRIIRSVQWSCPSNPSKDPNISIFQSRLSIFY